MADEHSDQAPPGVDAVDPMDALHAAAVAGDATAQVELGLMLSTGVGVPVDDGAAVSWLKKAADSNEVRALNALGLMHLKGFGVSRDSAQAAALFLRAAQLDDPVGCLNYGRAVLHGTGVEQDDATAMGWLSKASEAGLVQASFHVAMMLLDGYDGEPEPDPVRGLALLQRASNSGLSRATFELGRLHWVGNGDVGVAPNPSLALQCFLRASRGSHPHLKAMHTAALMLWRGEGLAAPERETAFELFAEAAQLGYAASREFIQVLQKASETLATEKGSGGGSTPGAMPPPRLQENPLLKKKQPPSAASAAGAAGAARAASLPTAPDQAGLLSSLVTSAQSQLRKPRVAETMETRPTFSFGEDEFDEDGDDDDDGLTWEAQAHQQPRARRLGDRDAAASQETLQELVDGVDPVEELLAGAGGGDVAQASTAHAATGSKSDGGPRKKRPRRRKKK